MSPRQPRNFLLLIVTSALLVAGSANGDILLNEPFDYHPGHVVGVPDNGEAYSGPWGAEGKAWFTGTAIEIDGGARASRPLAVALDDRQQICLAARMKVIKSKDKGGLRVGLGNAYGKGKLLGVQLLEGKAGCLYDGNSMRGANPVAEGEWIVLLLESRSEGEKSEARFWINPNPDALGKPTYEKPRNPDASTMPDTLLVNGWGLKSGSMGLVDAVVIASGPIEALNALGNPDE